MSDGTLRVVLDLNILISAYFFSRSDSPPRQILQAALDKRFIVLHSPDYRTDLVRAFSKQKFLTRITQINQTPQSIVDIITDLGVDVPSEVVPLDAVRDKDDAVILACAVGGNADYIVSGDHDLTVLKAYQNIPILIPIAFLTLLNQRVD